MRARTIVWRGLIVTHRYVGIAAGLLMLTWFVSGIVMMYVAFPGLTEGQRQRSLQPMSWLQCCEFSERLVNDDQTALRVQLENLLDAPTLRLRRAGRPDVAIDLKTGTAARIDIDVARAIAIDAAPRIVGLPISIIGSDIITSDQWTVGRYLRDRPLHRFSFDDAAGTNIYISGTTGQVVLWTTATQRFWNWLGAVPHWLYFTVLRENGQAWTQVVIWASIVGIFLTIVGLVLGVAQLKRGTRGRLSPFRGLFYWHHLAGLLFGIVTLTWVFSGLVSMNPWGFLDGRRGGEVVALQGATPRWADIKASLQAIQASAPAAVSLIAAPYAGRLYWLASGPDGRVTRLDAKGDPAPISDDDVAEGAQRIAGEHAIAERVLLTDEDDYYFRRRAHMFGAEEPFILPVYRITLDDPGATRYYLDPTTGALLQRNDADRRWHRWLFGGLHRLDFTAMMRTRPLWDMIVLTLMLGGSGVALTGVYLAWRRIRRDVAALIRSLGFRRFSSTSTNGKQPSPGSR